MVDGIDMLSSNEKHIEQKLGHNNLLAIANKYDPVCKKHRYELVDKPKKQPRRRFLRSDLALKVIMDCRKDVSCNLKRNLGLRLHDVFTKEQTVRNSTKDAFERENIQTQHSVLDYSIDLCFHKHKLATEVDELGHADRNLSNENERKKALEKELDCVFIRINPDEKHFQRNKQDTQTH